VENQTEGCGYSPELRSHAKKEPVRSGRSTALRWCRGIARV